MIIPRDATEMGNDQGKKAPVPLWALQKNPGGNMHAQVPITSMTGETLTHQNTRGCRMTGNLSDYVLAKSCC